MRKLYKRRPSAGVIIGVLALVLALGGGAYAAKKAKVTYKGLDKDARLKVLPVSKTNANTGSTPCDRPAPGPSPTAPRSRSTVRRPPVWAHGGLRRHAQHRRAPARGDCRLEADNNPINGTTIKVEATTSGANHGDGYGINIVTTPLGGQHTLSVACNETGAADLKVEQFQLSAISVR